MIVLGLDEQKRLKEEKLKKRNKFLKLYIIPIFTAIIFILIIVVLVVPKITTVFARLDEVSTNNENATQLAQKLSDIKALDASSDTILTNLDIVNEIATSQNTEVIKFRDKIADLTTQNNLVIISQQLTETIVPTDATNSGTGNVNLVEVPIIFEIVGSFTDIKNFIAALNTIDDFVIVKEMDLALREDEDGVDVFNQWSLKIDLVKYQFQEGADLEALYANVPPTAKISEAMKSYIDLRLQKAAELNESITEETLPTEEFPVSDDIIETVPTE